MRMENTACESEAEQQRKRLLPILRALSPCSLFLHISSGEFTGNSVIPSRFSTPAAVSGTVASRLLRRLAGLLSVMVNRSSVDPLYISAYDTVILQRKSALVC